MLYIIYGGIKIKKKTLQLFGILKTFIYLCIVNKGLQKYTLISYIIFAILIHFFNFPT